MLIIFGMRGRWSVRRHETGEFFCPKCGGDRQWVRNVLRRWFALFFVPLFPVGRVVAEAVQCTTCRTRFEPAVLAQPTASLLTAELQGTMRLAATEVVRVAGQATSAAAVDAVRGLGLDVYAAGSLDHDVQTLDPASLDPHLAYLAGALSLQGREQLLTTLAAVARSGGADAAALARPVLEHIGQGLDMSPAHVAGVIAAAATPSVAPPTSAVPPPPPPPAPSPSAAPLAAPEAIDGWAAPDPRPGPADGAG